MKYFNGAVAVFMVIGVVAGSSDGLSRTFGQEQPQSGSAQSSGGKHPTSGLARTSGSKQPQSATARPSAGTQTTGSLARTSGSKQIQSGSAQSSAGKQISSSVVQTAVDADSMNASAGNLTPSHAAYVPVTRFDPTRNAVQDIGLALTEAQRSNRRVLLDVGGAWCIWCRRLDSTFAKNRDLGALLHRKFVVVKVNYSKENKNEEALSRLPKIPGYPHLFVLSEEGLLLRSQETAELESGKGYDVEKLRTFILEWGHP